MSCNKCQTHCRRSLIIAFPIFPTVSHTHHRVGMCVCPWRSKPCWQETGSTLFAWKGGHSRSPRVTAVSGRTLPRPGPSEALLANAKASTATLRRAQLAWSGFLHNNTLSRWTVQKRGYPLGGQGSGSLSSVLTASQVSSQLAIFE